MNRTVLLLGIWAQLSTTFILVLTMMGFKGMFAWMDRRKVPTSIPLLGAVALAGLATVAISFACPT